MPAQRRILLVWPRPFGRPKRPSSYLSGLVEGVPTLGPRPCRRVGTPQPYPWRDYAALRSRPAPVQVCRAYLYMTSRGRGVFQHPVRAEAGHEWSPAFSACCQGYCTRECRDALMDSVNVLTILAMSLVERLQSSN
jgi:hypothetical protein